MNKEQYISDYNKKSYYSLLLRIPKKEKDLIERIEAAPSKNGYVLDLLRDDASVLRLSDIKRILKEVLGKHGIKRIFLFGSYARGEANRESDVDILCENGDISTLIEQGMVEDELEERLGKKVDLVFLNSAMPDHFREAMERDLIELC